MQYTVRNIPKAVDRALRERARRARTSLNDAAVAALTEALGLEAEQRARRDLRDIAGTWQQDPAVDDALEAQRRVDDELWR